MRLDEKVKPSRLAEYAVYISIFSVMLGLGVVFPVLSDIQSEFDATYSEISLAVSAFAIARLITNIPAGIAGAKYPPLPLLLIGSLSVAIGSLIAANSTSLYVLLLSRAASGIGSSITTTIGLSYVLETASAHNRGKASGTFHAALSGGAFFGPGIGGVIASFWGWRASLIGAALITLISSVLLLIASMTSTKYTNTEASRIVTSPSEKSPLGVKSFIKILIVGATAYAAAFAIFFARGSVQQTLVPLIGRDNVGLTTLELSILLMLAAGVGTLFGPIVGSLSDRIGRVGVIVPALSMLMIGTALLTTTSVQWLFVVGVMIAGFAGAANGIPSAMLADTFDGDTQRMAISIYRVIGDSALMVAPILSGVLVDILGFGWAGLGSIVIITVSLVIFLWSRKKWPQKNLISELI